MRPPVPFRPTREQLAEADGRLVPDILAPGLSVVFCGINPGRYSGAVGHHFARPGNRFWKVLEASGFTPRLLVPEEDRTLPTYGLGITNLVARTTASAAELGAEEIREGSRALVRKLRRYRPKAVAVLGLGAYRTAFGRPPTLGEQASHSLGDCRTWVLPNPSGLQARYQLAELSGLFAALRAALEEGSP